MAVTFTKRNNTQYAGNIWRSVINKRTREHFLAVRAKEPLYCFPAREAPQIEIKQEQFVIVKDDKLVEVLGATEFLEKYVMKAQF